VSDEANGLRSAPPKGAGLTERCPARVEFGDLRCELPAGHNSQHENTEHGKLTWEPAYVGDLRRELRNGSWRWKSLLEGVLSDLGPAMRAQSVDDAREALRGARA